MGNIRIVANPILPLESLISNPINALITSQYFAGLEIIEFIKKLADIDEESKILHLKTLDMAIGNKQQIVKIPLISLVPIPNIMIDKAEIDLDFSLMYDDSDKNNLKCYASHGQNKQDENIKMSITLTKQDIPQGLQTALSLSNNSMEIQNVV